MRRILICSVIGLVFGTSCAASFRAIRSQGGDGTIRGGGDGTAPGPSRTDDVSGTDADGVLPCLIVNTTASDMNDEGDDYPLLGNPGPAQNPNQSPSQNPGQHNPTTPSKDEPKTPPTTNPNSPTKPTGDGNTGTTDDESSKTPC